MYDTHQCSGWLLFSCVFHSTVESPKLKGFSETVKYVFYHLIEEIKLLRESV